MNEGTNMNDRLLTLDEIKSMFLVFLSEQTRIRRALSNQMVGSLYPSILDDEIHQLTLLRERLKSS